MKDVRELNGWNHVVYTIITSKFNTKTFSLKEIYAYFNHFKSMYPKNHHIEEKIRQTLQNLERFKIITRHKPGVYQLIKEEIMEQTPKRLAKDYVYLVSNESIPGWVKIGRTNSIHKMLRTLYNSSVPIPFKLEKTITTKSKEESLQLEKSIHSIIDTINPSLRKETAASKSDFFKIPINNGIEIFELVVQINSINIT